MGPSGIGRIPSANTIRCGAEALILADGLAAFGPQPAVDSHTARHKTASRAGVALDMNHPWVSSREENPFRRYSLP
jgi:hypothetical protein